jgi:hypothetical protein
MGINFDYKKYFPNTETVIVEDCGHYFRLEVNIQLLEAVFSQLCYSPDLEEAIDWWDIPMSEGCFWGRFFYNGYEDPPTTRIDLFDFSESVEEISKTEVEKWYGQSI